MTSTLEQSVEIKKLLEKNPNLIFKLVVREISFLLDGLVRKRRLWASKNGKV